MKREPWYESTDPGRVVRGGSWRVALWIVGVVVSVGLISAGIWALKVATSDIKGAGDQTRIVNSANNRIFDLYSDQPLPLNAPKLNGS